MTNEEAIIKRTAQLLFYK